MSVGMVVTVDLLPDLGQVRDADSCTYLLRDVKSTWEVLRVGSIYYYSHQYNDSWVSKLCSLKWYYN